MSIVKLSSEYVMGGFTPIDNIFICEYMSGAKDLDVKIYLYGLYLAHSLPNPDITDFERGLKVTSSEVVSAYKYFSELGLVELNSISPLAVTYLPIGSNPIKPRKVKEGKYNDFNKLLQTIISGRMITPTEFMDYYNVLELYHIQPDAFLLIARYCTEQKGAEINSRYIIQVAKNFAYKKATTLKTVEDELKNYTSQSKEVLKLFEIMNVKKKLEMEDNDLYKKWLSLGFDADAVSFAASTIKNGGMRKLDAFILELYSYKKFSREEIENFAASKQETVALCYEINKTLGVFYDSVESEITNYISKWLEKGFTPPVLKEIARLCFLRSLRTLNAMDEFVQKLYKMGIVTLEGISDFIERTNKEDSEIAKMLEILRLSRSVNKFDREQFNRFHLLGATNELIFYAAELSADKTSPYPYMLAILTNWKKDGISTVDEAKKKSTAGTPQKAKRPASENIMTRDYSKEEIQKMFDSIDSFEVI